jgi:DNA repair protein RadD
MITPYYYQANAVRAIFEYFDTGGRGNPVLALPTGTGKSLIPPLFIVEVMRHWPNQRFMILTHVKELVSQNADKMIKVWPDAPMGIYSAGLGIKDTMMPITFGGVASVYKRIEAFGHIDILFIDECHLLNLNSTSMYMQLIAKLRANNPYLKVIGLTATPFRLGQGYVTDGGLFTDIIVNLCRMEEFNRLVAEGYMCPLIPKRTATEIDTSGVGIQNGDYSLSQLAAALDVDSLTKAICTEICQWGADRRSWLIFCSGIEHADHVAEVLRWMGVPTASVHSKSEHRDKHIEDYQAGKLRALTNNNVLTTGFDDPKTDLIAMCRPTLSPGLWVQMLGRGTRISPITGKIDCRVLDFARNTANLGPINDPRIPRKKLDGPGGDAPVKICDNCGTYNHASVRFCIQCGSEFHFQTKIVKTADTAELIRGDFPIFEEFDVDRVIYVNSVGKDSGKNYIRVCYYCDMRMFSEPLMLEHGGMPGKRSRDWWRQRYHSEPPATCLEAMQFVNELRVPKRIRVWVNKKYPEIMSHEW